MHAGRRYTLAAIIKTMEVDAAIKFVYAESPLKINALLMAKLLTPVAISLT
jgi:hypothetical protein